MRRFVLAVLPLGLFFATGPSHVPLAHAATTTSAGTQIDTWSARRHHRSHRTARQQTSRGFAWFFANPGRSSGQGSCFGNRVVATWYQSGRRTASGAAFNPGGFTAAHRSLPFGSRVTVTNPRNGQSVTVTINDRGPFTRGVTLDLARGAAHSIGMNGTQQVCMS